MIDKRIYEQFNARAPFKLEDATILVLAMVGSHSHGTYIPPEDPQAIDDVDYMGVIIPPRSYTFGLKEWEGLNFQFEELDCVFYSFRKFTKLLIKSNPNVLGLLWLKDEHYIHTEPTLWDWVVAAREDFSSLNAIPAFMGYATAQLHKMTSFDLGTQTHYDDSVKLVTAAGWTVDMVVKNQSRPMPDMVAVSAVLDGWSAGCDINERGPAQDRLMLDDAVKDIHHTHAKHFQGYMGEKRKNLVRKYGYDTKNAAHLIRLLRMLSEYLVTGKLNVFRTEDADEIRDIKAGKWSLDDVKKEAEYLIKWAEDTKPSSPLPESPNVEAIDHLVQDIYLQAYGLEKFHICMV